MRLKCDLLNSDGFLYGYGLFETMRSYNGKIFALDEHLDRLFKSARKINLKITRSRKTIKKAILQAGRTKFRNTYIRLNVWKQGEKSNFNVISRKYSAPSSKKYRQGFKALVSSFVVNERSPLTSVKSLNYLLNILARSQAEKNGFDEAILLNTRGFIAEGSRSNIFLVKNGALLTPSLDCGILPGITRKMVIGSAKKLGIKVKEAHLALKTLKNADEIFITNSLLGIMPLIQIGFSARKKAGPLTQKLILAYQKMLPEN